MKICVYKGFIGNWKGVEDILRHSALATNAYRLLQPYWVKWKNESTFKMSRKDVQNDNNININPVDYDLMEYYLYSNSRMPEIEAGFSMTGELFAAIKEFVEKSGKKFLVVFIPTRYQVTGILNENWNSPPDNKFIDAPNKRLGVFCKNNAILYVDLTSALRDAFSKGIPVFPFQNDKHWGKEGQRIASEVVAKQFW